MLNPAILTQILRGQLSPIQGILDDTRVTEIMINPGGRAFVKSTGLISDRGFPLGDNAINMAIITASVEDFRIAGALKPV